METHKFVELTIKSLMATGADPNQILTGIHNAFVHGQILTDAGYDVADADLIKLFDGFALSASAMKKITT